MNFLPIALRELQVTARRAMTYYWRSLSALNAACVTLGCLLVGFSGAVSASSAGEMTFQILSGIGYGVTAVTAALATSDCISEERRDGTLGFLFLTDLKGYDIVMGKLARLSAPVYCLIAAFPALGFTMLLGGVSLGDFAMIALSLVNTLFFFSALGMLISARSWDGRAALSASMLGAVIFSAPMGGRAHGPAFCRPVDGSSAADAVWGVSGGADGYFEDHFQTKFLLVPGRQPRDGMDVHRRSQLRGGPELFQGGAAAGGADANARRVPIPPWRSTPATRSATLGGTRSGCWLRWWG